MNHANRRLVVHAAGAHAAWPRVVLAQAAAVPVRIGMLSGGNLLVAFAAEWRRLYERVPVFIDKILEGASPAEIPVEQPTRAGLWVNLKTARALGITIPQLVLLRAERVIE